MKKFLFSLLLIIAAGGSAMAQKYAVVDIEYILKNVPSYETANEQIGMISKRWQKEVEAKQQEVQILTKNYQTELVFLSEDMKARREQEIVSKEKEANELKIKYFGQSGELYKKREALIKPIQDEIYTAIQDVAKEKNLDMVFDRSSMPSLIYSVPKIDISDAVLQKLGYAK
ncbi:MAG: OmpH family outer membrane protein [Paludibacteraceae bacterium]|nr:OmpH family outer membrane protein [Paludibacteraceae bacterium]